MKISTSLVSILALAFSAASAEDCSISEEQLEFTFFLDEDSLTENGWSLACDGYDASWYVPIGSLQSTDPQAMGYVNHDVEPSFVKEQVCIPKDVTCHFTLEDSHGDGLLFPGYYYLTFGAQTIAVSEDEEEFFEKTFCFGPNCPIPSQEVADETCDQVHLFAKSDETPQQNTISIECNNQIVFVHSFSVPAETVEFDECIPTSKCCTLTVVDSAGDGMDIPQGGQIFAEWANEVILRYDDASNAFEFTNVEYNFGLGCANVDANPPQVEEEEPVQEQPPAFQETKEDLDNEIFSPDPSDEVLSTGTKNMANTLSSSSESLSGAEIAFIVFGGLSLIGLVVFLIVRCTSTSSSNLNSNVSMIGKEIDVQSQATDESDVTSLP